MSLVIAIDCDDVLTDTLPKVVHDYNERYGTNVELQHMYREFDEVLAPFGVQNVQEAIQRLHSIYRQKGYYEALQPVAGAVEAIKKLANKHELHVVTGRQSFLEAATKHTLDTYFPGAFTSVEHTNYYKDDTETHAVTRSKAEVCLEIGTDILIDDHVVHCEDVLNAGVKEVILFGDYPWNKRDKLVPGVRRCNNWSDVLTEVERINAAR
jgi:5'(3')-deoxyribonucleotidase